jgi:para-nitrobenzyl esterase
MTGMATDSPVVRTGQGQVRGRVEHGHAVFRGIPFARPPFGAFRLAAPHPPEPWEGVRDAAAFGPAPPQPSEALGAARPLPDSGAAGPGADPLDCLTVNVWSPDPGGAGLPVLVWIYGGAYLFGQAGQPMYDGSALAAGGVVVVTFNYRVGMEGFGEVGGAPPNRGLLDQVAALRWVAENIAAFGGDPGNVTVFGESAGAGSIAALLVMPGAAGLLRRAIAQSVPGTYFSAALAADIGEAIAAGLGRRATVADLAETDPGELVRAAGALIPKLPGYADRWGQVAHTPTPFSPVVDGEVLPQPPWPALAAGAAHSAGADLIVGCNRDEYRLFVMLGTGGVKHGDVSAEHAATALRVFASAVGGEAAYRAAYPTAGPEHLYELVHSDWLFRMPSFQLADAHAAGSAGRGATFCYELCWEAPAASGPAGGVGSLGACHGLDVPLVFGALPLLPAALGLAAGPTPEAMAVSRWMRSAWTRFAADGNPGWPAYEPGQRLTQIIDAEPSVQPAPEAASRHIWAGHTFGTLDLV